MTRKLLDHIAVLRGASALLDVDVPTPWPTNNHEPAGAAPVLRVAAQQDDPSIGVEQGDTVVQPNDAHHGAQAVEHDVIDSDCMWVRVAERVCADDPARRRCPSGVAEILRLHHDSGWTYPRIAGRVEGFGTHAVGRVIRHARKYRPTRHARADVEGRQ